MHDPMTVAFEIRYPWRKYGARGASEFLRNYREAFITIWHVDPEKDGSDDSCDWFGRKRKLAPREKALWHALDDLFHTLGNHPFYPDPRLHGLVPHGDDERKWGVVGQAQAAMYRWRAKPRLRLHPRWHVWHWKIQVHPLQNFKRWAFTRCTVCGNGFAWGAAVFSGSWNGTGPRWFRSERNVYHGHCDTSRVSSPDDRREP